MTLLLSVTIKVAILTLGGLGTIALLRKHSAAMRHWVLATTMLGCLFVPAVELFLPSWSVQLPADWLTPSVTSSLRLSSRAPEPRVGAATATADSNALPANSMLSPAVMLTGAWIGGALLGLSVLSVGLLRLRNLAAKSEPVSTGTWREVTDEISMQYGIRRHIRLLKCPHPALLATWGLANPTILLPEGADIWAEERVRVVIRHELAHILRGDWIVALTGNVLRAVYWFNPLLWIACRQLRHEGERACDDLVLASGISASDYAAHLLDVARESVSRRHRWSPAIAIAHHSMLEGRVRAMLNARLNRKPLTTFMRATTVAAIAAVALSVGVVSLSGSTPASVSLDSQLSPSGTIPLPAADPVRAFNAPSLARAEAPAQAQAKGGTIEGVLYDQFGGLLPGVAVTLTQAADGSARNSQTDRGGLFVFRDLTPGDYEVSAGLPGFLSVKVVVRAEPAATVRRHITLPVGTLEETIQVTCSIAGVATSRPSAPAGSAIPGAASQQAAGPRGAEPKIPSTFSGGIGGQIRVPRKISHTNPVCPTGVTPEPTVVKLAGRIGIDGLFTDLRAVNDAAGPYAASALDGTRQWVFTPTLLNDAPIEVNINVTVMYSWSN
jgi:beta-lactamase regulating signal transducer with metallopeptidase domain